MMYRLMILAAALLLPSMVVAARGGGGVDVHMHLHPQGLDKVMGGRAAHGQGDGATQGRGQRGVPFRRGGPPGPGRMDGLPLEGRFSRHGADGRPAAAGEAFGPGGGARQTEGTADNLKQAAAQLVGRLDEQGLERALVVVVPNPQGRTTPEETYRWMRDAVQSQPSRLSLLAGGAILGKMLQGTPPEGVDESLMRRFEEKAESLLAEGAVGFGEMISLHLCLARNHAYIHTPADHPLFLRLADVAARHDVAVDLHMEAVTTSRMTPANLRRACDANPQHLPASVPALERLLAHNRKARIVWQHIGWDNVGEMTPALVRRLLGSHPNLHIALRLESRPMQVGGGGAMPNTLDRGGPLAPPTMKVNGDFHGNRSQGQARGVSPAWLEVINAFPERVVVGSDEFISPSGDKPRMAASYDETWGLVRQLPPDLARRLTVENPRRIYRLDRL